MLIPGARVRYLAEIAEQGRAINAGIDKQAEAANRAQAHWISLQDIGDRQLPKQLDLYGADDLLPARSAAATSASETPVYGSVDSELQDPGNRAAAATGNTYGAPDPHGIAASQHAAHRHNEPVASEATSAASAVDRTLLTLRQRYNDAVQALSSESLKLLREWPARLKSITDEVTEYQVRGKTIRVENYRDSLSHQKIPKIAAPTYKNWGELLTFLGKENLPGYYPYTGGVYPYRRTGEDPIRMFAGEGTPERTNRRFHYLSVGQPAARLSTAFDSVTLYGEDPAVRPDIYGKVGNSGVNVPTLDDMKKL